MSEKKQEPRKVEELEQDIEQYKDKSLVEHMQDLYVDPDGNTLIDAVDLGMLFLAFFDGVAKCKEIAYAKALPLGSAIDHTFLALIESSSSKEGYEKHEKHIRSRVERWKAHDKDLGLQIQDVIYSTFLPCLDNKLFMHETANVALRFAWFEGMNRHATAYFFAANEPMIGFANLQCSYSILSLIAFLCSQDIETYKKMSTRVEQFVFQSSKRVLPK